MNEVWQETKTGLFVTWDLWGSEKPVVELTGISINIISGDKNVVANMAKILEETTQRIRKQIAQEIEELQCNPRTCEDYRKGDECYNKNALIELTAMVARGER
jgi:hypothetical protein